MNSMKGTFMKGIRAPKGSKPEFKPSTPPIPATVVQVISVEKPKPDVGMTRGKVIMSSKRLFPGKLFLART